jgi:orotate phosphoribosyltransferase
MTPDEARELLEETGAMLTGHFLLSSGRHSDRYVEKARVLEQPEAVARFAREMASWHPGVDTVVAPAVGAVALGFAVALEAGARFVFAEREDGRMTLRRGFQISPGERVLVVEDVITTGASAGEVYDLIEALAADRVGVVAMVDRSQAEPPFPLRAVVRIEAVSWDPEHCPICREGRAIDSPGSRRLAAGGQRSPSSRG